MALPPAGRGFGNYTRNPTLIPNFDKSVVSLNGVTDHKSPAEYLLANPQGNAAVTAVVGGSVTTADTITLTINNAVLTGGSITAIYTVAAGDTLGTVAEGLANVLNKAAFNVVPEVEILANEGTVTINWPGPIGNSATLTDALSGGATETITLSPVGGVLAGGTGPVFAFSNFTFSYNGSTLSFFYGQPYSLGADLVRTMVAQGMPIG